MAKANNGMLFFYDWIEALESIPPKEFKTLVMAMLAYSRDGVEPPEMKGNAKLAASFIFPAIGRSRAISAKRSASGKAGMAARWGSENSASMDVKTDNKTITNDNNVIPHDITKNNYKTRQDKDKTKTKHTPLPPEGEKAADAAGCVCLESFEKFWEKYPKKTARKEALTIWQALDPDEALIDRILAAVDAQSATQAWQTEGGRYVPMAAVWLEGERWNDEIAPPCDETGEEGECSFDGDEFWEAALAKSYGESEVHS